MDYVNDNYEPEDNQIFTSDEDDAYFIHPFTGKKVYL